jgi:hypothetical protein
VRQVTIFATAGDFLRSFAGRLIIKVTVGAIATLLYSILIGVIGRALYAWWWLNHPGTC